MKKNLVISPAVGLEVDQVLFFIKSLRKYYKDDVCLVIGEKDLALENELEKYQIITIKTNIAKKAIQLKRYGIFLNFLKDKNYKNILFCDCRDIYFQSNPFDFNYKGEINFFLEDKKIMDCPVNSNWMKKTYGEKVFNSLKNKTILCGGTILGSYDKIKEYLNLMISNLSKFKYKRRLKYSLTFRLDPEGRGSDQSPANFLVYKDLIKNAYCYSNKSGPFATVLYLKNLSFNKKKELINSLNEPYVLVHQYDKRWVEFKDSVNENRKQLGLNQIP